KLEPALQWKTRIVHINAITAGTAVGYGCTYRPVQDSNIAVLPVGYFEGYDRRLSNKAHVLISGKRAPVIGRVCMNMIMVDITHIADAKVGSVATLIGTDEKESVTADDLADWMGTINYEVTTKIEPGIPRILVD
ncbi:MAG TPA: alanine racemase C-terminal domain-containing protein, partial [Leptospiraceae bacterium]|nr:alanine racemase C-terminal domain-containing protein [Leptospiraceae bacterium]